MRRSKESHCDLFCYYYGLANEVLNSNRQIKKREIKNPERRTICVM